MIDLMCPLTEEQRTTEPWEIKYRGMHSRYRFQDKELVTCTALFSSTKSTPFY